MVATPPPRLKFQNERPYPDGCQPPGWGLFAIFKATLLKLSGGNCAVLPPKKGTPMFTLYTMVAPCFFRHGIDAKLRGQASGRTEHSGHGWPRGVSGRADIIAAANLNLRTAERVLLLLATYKATTFDELFDGCYNIAWEELLPPPMRPSRSRAPACPASFPACPLARASSRRPSSSA